MKIKVINLHMGKDPSACRCDRVSVLGNPFGLRSEAQRDEVVAAFREYLYSVTILRVSPVDAANRVAERRGLSIMNTWRYPTHREVIAELEELGERNVKEELTLACWCAPKPCHADVLKSYLQWREWQADSLADAMEGREDREEY